MINPPRKLAVKPSRKPPATSTKYTAELMQRGCAVCDQRKAAMRCSRCHNLYYCCVADWKRHESKKCIPASFLATAIQEMFVRVTDRVEVRQAFYARALNAWKEYDSYEMMHAFEPYVRKASGVSVIGLCAALPATNDRDKQVLKIVVQHQSKLLVEAAEARLCQEEQEFTGPDYAMLLQVTRDFQAGYMAAQDHAAPGERDTWIVQRKIKREIDFLTTFWPAHLAQLKLNLAKLYRKVGADFIQDRQQQQHLDNWQSILCKMEFLMAFEVGQSGSYVLNQDYLKHHPRLGDLRNKIGRVFHDLIMVLWVETIQVLKLILGQPTSHVARKKNIPGWETETEQWLREASHMVGEDINIPANFLDSLVRWHLIGSHPVEKIRAFLERMGQIWARFLEEE